MAGRPLLTRRSTLAAVAALAARRAAAETDDRQRITLGKSTFLVPKPYLFGEFLPPGTATDGLPPRFSFAFTAPDGAPAGQGLEFPPMSHPYVLERENGQFLVMCYRVSASGPGALNKAPREQLANNLTTTDRYLYGKEDGALIMRFSMSDPREQRYVSLVEDKNRSGIEAFLSHLENAQFLYGNAAFEKPDVTTVIYIPQQHHQQVPAVLAQASDLLFSWKEP